MYTPLGYENPKRMSWYGSEKRYILAINTLAPEQRLLSNYGLIKPRHYLVKIDGLVDLPL